MDDAQPTHPPAGFDGVAMQYPNVAALSPQQRRGRGWPWLCAALLFVLLTIIQLRLLPSSVSRTEGATLTALVAIGAVPDCAILDARACGTRDAAAAKAGMAKRRSTADLEPRYMLRRPAPRGHHQRIGS